MSYYFSGLCFGGRFLCSTWSWLGLFMHLHSFGGLAGPWGFLMALVTCLVSRLGEWRAGSRWPLSPYLVVSLSFFTCSWIPRGSKWTLPGP